VFTTLTALYFLIVALCALVAGYFLFCLVGLFNPNLIMSLIIRSEKFRLSRFDCKAEITPGKDSIYLIRIYALVNVVVLGLFAYYLIGNMLKK
jgi:hypothetical protein